MSPRRPLPRRTVRHAVRAGLFDRLSDRMSEAAGAPPAFLIACAFVVGWSASALMFSNRPELMERFSFLLDGVTFLMLFVFQASQNRDTLALHINSMR